MNPSMIVMVVTVMSYTLFRQVASTLVMMRTPFLSFKLILFEEILIVVVFVEVFFIEDQLVLIVRLQLIEGCSPKHH
jgi:hypothetical protein